MPAAPRYPIYVPSKGRYETCFTAQFLQRDGVPFYLVVEPQEAAQYAKRFGEQCLLVLPWQGDDSTRRQFCKARGIENGGLIAVRNWIKEHATAAGHLRHWQLDDNIRRVHRRVKARRIECASGPAFAVVEDFVDRYENVALAGMAYSMLCADGQNFKPFVTNCHVYSCTLVLNSLPYRWRLAYNDDTDLCLQVLSAGWCTVLVNAFLCEKMRTMVVKGGNTDDLYRGDGRLRMARSLERMWPGIVETKRRFGRPQHMVAKAWKAFDTPLKLKPGVDLQALAAQPNEYGLVLAKVKPIRSAAIAQLHREFKTKGKAK